MGMQGLEPLERHAREVMGGWLRNTLVIPGRTCGICRTPVAGFSRCFPCQQAVVEYGSALADRLGIVAYGVDGAQSAWMMRGYKGRRSVAPLQEHVNQVKTLTWLGARGHMECVGALAGTPVTHWATVPSLPRRDGRHALNTIVGQIFDLRSEIVLTSALSPRDPRALDPAHFVPTRPADPVRHVLLIDDAWVRGGHAQPAAMSLRALGDVQVSLLAVARWLRPDFKDNADFIRECLIARFDPLRCPWTAGACPRHAAQELPGESPVP